LWPRILRSSTSHEEGCTRHWSVLTKKLIGTDVRVSGLEAVKVRWEADESGYRMHEEPGTEFSLKADLVVLAMGFVHVVHRGLVETLDLELDGRGNLVVDEEHMTSREGIFAAGDSRRGASLIVHAICEGRKAAEAIDRWLREQ
jgi:glutamate synthase (NADPH/NADH) small chain